MLKAMHTGAQLATKRQLSFKLCRQGLCHSQDSLLPHSQFSPGASQNPAKEHPSPLLFLVLPLFIAHAS